MNKDRHRLSIGLSIGNTVPLWGRPRWRSLFYVWANRPDQFGYGGFGIKAGFVFIRVCYDKKCGGFQR